MVLCAPLAACFLASSSADSSCCDEGALEGAPFVKVSFNPSFDKVISPGSWDLQYGTSADFGKNHAAKLFDSKKPEKAKRKPFKENIIDDTDDDAYLRNRWAYATMEHACLEFTDQVKLDNPRLAALGRGKKNLRGGEGAVERTVGFYRGEYKGKLGTLKRGGKWAIGGLGQVGKVGAFVLGQAANVAFGSAVPAFVINGLILALSIATNKYLGRVVTLTTDAFRWKEAGAPCKSDNGRAKKYGRKAAALLSSGTCQPYTLVTDAEAPKGAQQAPQDAQAEDGDRAAGPKQYMVMHCVIGVKDSSLLLSSESRRAFCHLCHRVTI
ncbi:unnamed protein product [Amoebophrya sp. A25]|nr:unnamed protein product [Amoebophrya sp. A25]|eukprot:GSA25T00014520001.1